MKKRPIVERVAQERERLLDKYDPILRELSNPRASQIVRQKSGSRIRSTDFARDALRKVVASAAR